MKTKKLLALLLSVAMMLSVVVAFPLESTALDGYTWYRINPNYSTDEAQNYGYIHMYPAGTAGQDGVGGGYFNESAQTYKDIKTYGYFHKAKTPHGIFYLYAENDTVLNLTTSYGTNAHTVNADYAMLLSVNDTDYYVGNGGTLSGTWVTDDMFTNVVLQKGVNVIRLIPTGLFPAGNSAWCDLNCINIENGKGVRALNHAELGTDTYGTTADEFNALYKTNYSYSSNENCLGGCWGANDEIARITLANRASYSTFSVTVDAPRDGYYEMEMNFNTGLKGNFGEVAVFVDNLKHRFAYYDFDNSLTADNSAFSGLVYMTAGRHVITVSRGYNNNNNAYWHNYGKMTLYGGATFSDTQIDPATIVEELTPLYAADYAYLNNSQLSSNETCSTDSTKLKATFFQHHVEDKTNQPYSDMKLNGLSDNAIASFDYSVKAETAGEYTVAPFLQIGVNDASALAENGYFVIVAVNNDQVYKANLKGGWYDPTFRVNMIAGVNLVRVIVWHNDVTWTKQPNDSLWLNHEYLRVSEGLTGVAPGARTTFRTGDLTVNKFDVNKDAGSLGNVGGHLGDLASSSISGDNLTYSDLSIVPHFAVTLEAENSGYYNFMLDTTCATDGATGYFNVFVDSTRYKIHYYQVKQWHSAASITVYIPKGAHILTVTNVWGYTGDGVTTGNSGEKFTNWCDFNCININGGALTLSDEVVNPNMTVEDYIAIYNANIMNYALADDPASVTTALEALLAEINSYDGTGKDSATWDSELSAMAATAPDVAANAREESWAAEKASALTEVDTYTAIYPGHANTAALAETAKSTIESAVYNDALTYSENVAVITDALAAKATIEANLASDTADFEAAKGRAATAIENNYKKAGDSAATTAILDKAIADVNALTYDVTLDYTNNNKRLSSIVSTANKDANAQRAAELAANKQAVEALKEELAVEVDESALAGDTAAVEALIAAAKAEVEAYTYDESKSVEENKAAVNAITTALEATLEANRKAVEDQLHVWRQYENGITAESETANVRFIFTLDTTTNDYVDFGFYLTINGVRVKYSYLDCEIDTLGAYDPIYFDNSDKANKIVYTYITVSNGAFNQTVTAEAYFTDANGVHLGAAATANVAEKFNLG